MSQRTYISVDRREYDGALQISIGVEDTDGSGHGYRIAGPKYDGRGTTLIKHFITERDIAEIVGYLQPPNRLAQKIEEEERREEELANGQFGAGA